MTSHDPPPNEDDDRTRQLDAVDGDGPGEPGREPLEATVDHGQRTGAYGAPPPGTGPYGQDPSRRQPAYEDTGPEPDEPRRRWGKGTMLVLLGAVIGIIVAFIVIALGTDSSPTTTGPSEAAMERIDELEAELGERDAQIADLEAQLAEADAEAGETDEAIAAQREALDQRAEELDARASAIDDREGSVTDREQAVDERERSADAREQALEEAEEGDNGIELPDLEIDEDEVDGFIDELLERIRDLF